MYILLNALKNIRRNKGRNLLIGAIIFVLITVSIVSLCINNTTNSIIDDYKTRFGSEVTIAPDMEKIITPGGTYSGKSAAPITAQQYLEFAQSEYLKESSLIGSISVGNDDIKAVDEDAEGSITIGNLGGELPEDYVSPKMSLVANKLSDFTDGFRKLADGGQMPESLGECVVSTEFADLNNFEVGDTFKAIFCLMVSENGEQVMEKIETELTITGIYYDTTEPYASFFKMASNNRRNEILTTLETLTNDFSTQMSVTAKYYLKNPSMLTDFEAELRSLGLDEYYKVSTDEEGYQKVVGPVEGLKKVSLSFMIIVLAFGAIVLVLLSSIAIRERKYEVGVLRAMGMKKSRVALGLWYEMLILTTFCLCIGFAVGTIAAQPVSDTLLAGQIESAENAKQQNNSGGFVVVPMGGEEELTPLDEVDVSLGMDTALQIAGIALLLASVAALASIGKITKYEPIKILMERN